MFETERFGLEMPLERLEAALPDMPVTRVARFLQHARLGRFGLNSSLFSFTHRRFNEFFLVRWFLENPERVWRPAVDDVGKAASPPIASTTGEGRWRDALVLYAQVAPEMEAERIAAHCISRIEGWQAANQETGADYMEGLQALRFTAEAFRGRLNALAPFESFLAHFVERAVRSDDILIQKHATEALGLVTPRLAGPLLQNALGAGSFWVRETAFRACRYLPEVSPAMIQTLKEYIISIPAEELRRQYGELDKLFTVVEPFRQLRRHLCLRVWEARLGQVGLGLLPFVSLPSALIAMIGADLRIKRTTEWSSGLWQMRSTLHSKAGVMAFQMTGMIFLFYPTIYNFVNNLSSGDLSSVHEDNFFLRPNVHFSYPIMIISPLTFFCASITNSLDSFLVFSGLGLIIYFVFFLPLTSLSQWLTQDNIFTRMYLALWRGLVAFVKGFADIFFWVVSVIFGVVIASFSGLFGETLKLVSSLILVLFLSTYFLTILWSVFLEPALKYYRSSNHDRTILRNLGQALPVSRTAIATQFMNFRSEKGRLRYIAWLEAHANSLEAALSDPRDRWPDERRPNLENNEASSRLARLDERWLGLNR